MQTESDRLWKELTNHAGAIMAQARTSIAP
jgi:hypothetical protein